MHIGICDDNADDSRRVRSWLERNNIQSNTLHEFTCGEDLLAFLQTHRLSILFLDAKMDGMDGIGVACAIRQDIGDRDMIILMLSDYPLYAVDGYDADIARYMIKKDFHRRIDSVWNHVQNTLAQRESSTFAFQQEGKLRIMPTHHILYLESSLRKMKLFMQDGMIHEFYGRISEYEDRLKPQGFLRTHHSFLVNSKHIVSLQPQVLLLSGGQSVPVSRRRYQAAFSEMTLYHCGRIL